MAGRAKGPRGGLGEGSEGEESTPEQTSMVIHRLVHLPPREYQARLPQLTRVRGPRRFRGALTQKPCEDSDLPSMLWVWERDEERRRMVGYKGFEAYLEEKFPDSRRKSLLHIDL